MNQKQFLKHIETTFKNALELIRRKNQDYSKTENAFANFEFARLVGLDVSRAILLRVVDKIARLSNLLDKDIAVVDESLQDTCIDVVNYMAILMAYLDNEKQKGA